MSFSLTPKQLEAQRVIAGQASRVMLFGGSRSAKTFLWVRNIVHRALRAPGSRHAIFRFRYNHLRASVVLDTLPKVMRLAFPGVPYKDHSQDGFASFPDGSEIWFAGLDEKERTEKVLGQEFATLFFNEGSQIPYSSVLLARTRLAQKCDQRDGRPLRLREFHDCNPPPKGHWAYRLFIQHVEPDTKRPVPDPEEYAAFQMNPRDNPHLPAEYLRALESLPAHMRARFLDGEFADENPNALFKDQDIDRWRVLDGRLPDMVRVVVAVDPSGSGDEDNADNDEIGIVVVGLGTDGNAYLLEDCTVKAGPATWGRVATGAYERHAASCVVAETNFGGAMVQQTIQAARARTPYKPVRASRGKVQRAEPFSALYEQGKVRHVGVFPELESELAGFSTVGYVGSGSPNRADALIWGLAELFPWITANRTESLDFNESSAVGAVF